MILQDDAGEEQPVRRATTGDHPFAVWNVFRGAPQWWFARGCPPTIRELSGWTRVLHVSMLLGVMGLSAASLGALVLVTARMPPPWDGIGFGAIYAAIVLVPLSRWVGRAWWWALLSVPFLAGWYGSPSLEWIQQHMQYYYSAHYWKLSVDIRWLVTSTSLGIGPGLWMISLRRPRTWLILPVIGLACIVSAAAVPFGRHSSFSGWRLPFALPQAVEMLVDLQPVILFFALIAAALGMRLWDLMDAQPTVPCPSRRSRRESEEGNAQSRQSA